MRKTVGFIAGCSFIVAMSAHAEPPTFTAEHKEHTNIATAAWRQATLCAGWEAKSHARVAIRQGLIHGGYTGGALLDDDGLYIIQLKPDASPRTLVHEVTHAWARFGPAALTEGRTDLLADCIVKRLPEIDVLDPDTGRNLKHMPDLIKWKNPQTDFEDVDFQKTRKDAYLGATRLVRVVAEVVDPQKLWPEDGRLTWSNLTHLLENAGPRGQAILTSLEGGPKRLRHDLSDQDHDGVPWIGEILAGTSPEHWDSDGDGWWDGAEIPPFPTAQPIPMDGTPICAGRSASRQWDRLFLVRSNQMRGYRLPILQVRSGEHPALGDPAHGFVLPTKDPILISLGTTPTNVTGGTWVIVDGPNLQTNTQCLHSSKATLWTRTPHSSAVMKEILRQLDAHILRSNSLIGKPSKSRYVVVLNSDEAKYEGGALHIPPGLLTWAEHENRLDALAGLAVAMHRVWQDDNKRWDTAEGLIRALVDNPPDVLFISVDDDDADRWLGEANTCATGWQGILTGDCQPRKR